jgi:hypothetical protein
MLFRLILHPPGFQYSISLYVPKALSFKVLAWFRSIFNGLELDVESDGVQGRRRCKFNSDGVAKS